MKEWLVKWELLGRPGTFTKPMSDEMLCAAPEEIFKRLARASEGGAYITSGHYPDSGHGVGFYSNSGYIFAYRDPAGRRLWEVSTKLQEWNKADVVAACKTLKAAQDALREKAEIKVVDGAGPYPS